MGKGVLGATRHHPLRPKGMGDVNGGDRNAVQDQGRQVIFLALLAYAGRDTGGVVWLREVEEGEERCDPGKRRQTRMGACI
jgi:hypothetical protein